MVFIAFRDPRGWFRARVPSTWLVEQQPQGATLFREPRWNEHVSVSVTGVSRTTPGRPSRRPLRDFPQVMHPVGGGLLARTWNGVHGSSLVVVTHTFPVDFAALPREQATLVLETLEFTPAPEPWRGSSSQVA